MQQAIVEWELLKMELTAGRLWFNLLEISSIKLKFGYQVRSFWLTSTASINQDSHASESLKCTMNSNGFEL